jgi:hypothetical protein
VKNVTAYTLTRVKRVLPSFKPNPNRASFMDLPGEVRNKIYALVIPTEERITKEPAILRANKQIRAECISLFYSQNAFANCFKPSKLRNFINSQAASYLEEIFVLAPFEKKFRVGASGIIIILYATFIYFDLSQWNAETWIDEKVFVELGEWAKNNLGEQLTGRDLVTVARKLGAAEWKPMNGYFWKKGFKVNEEYSGAHLSCEGWDKGDSFKKVLRSGS